MCDGTATNNEENKALMKAHAEKKVETGPSKLTLSQLNQTAHWAGEVSRTETVGYLNREVKIDVSTPSFNINDIDDKETIEETGRAEDGRDETIAPSKCTMTCFLSGIRKISKISKNSTG